MVGAKLETLTHGQTAAEMPIGMFVITRAKAAELLNVGERSVARPSGSRQGRPWSSSGPSSAAKWRCLPLRKSPSCRMPSSA